MSETISKNLIKKWEDAGYMIEYSSNGNSVFMTRIYRECLIGIIEKQIWFYDDKNFDAVFTDSNFDRVPTKERFTMTELALINATVKELGWV